MRRIATSNAAINLFGAGKNGFQASSPGVTATHWSSAFANDIQEEIIAAIELAGITLDPDGTHEHQLLQAMQQMFGGAVIVKTHANNGQSLLEAEAGLVLLDATGGAVNLTLPSCVRPMVFSFYRIDATPANGSTITCAGTEEFNGAGSPGSFTMKPLERRQMMSYAGGWEEFSHTHADGELANIWQAQGSPGGGTTTSTTYQSAGSTCAVTKKRATNTIEWLCDCTFSNDTSSSPSGAQAKARVGIDTGSGYGLLGLERNVGWKTVSGGASLVLSNKFAAVVQAHDDGTHPLTYNAQAQFASLAGAFVNNLTSNLIGIERWN